MTTFTPGAGAAFQNAASLMAPEGWDVFEKWFKEMERKMHSLFTQDESAVSSEMAARLGIPGDILNYVIRKMVGEGKIEIIRVRIWR